MIQNLCSIRHLIHDEMIKTSHEKFLWIYPILTPLKIVHTVITVVIG